MSYGRIEYYRRNPRSPRRRKALRAFDILAAWSFAVLVIVILAIV